MTRYAPVELLTSEHDRSSFNCGSSAQTEWLTRHALLAQQADTARVYVIRPHGEPRVAGYYGLSAGSVESPHASARLASGTGRHPIPVVILTRLGVDLRDQGRGLGSELVRDAFLQTAAIADRIGARALLIHAETAEVASFYRRLDPAFEPSPADPLQLVLLLKDLRAGVRNAAARIEAARRGQRVALASDVTVNDWLLDADLSIRWQVMRDLTHPPADVIAAERAKIATSGWGARLLALQAPDGLWGGEPWSHDWKDTFHVLELLRRFGLDPASEGARRAVGLVREHVTWRDSEFETPWADNRFFEGEVEPCINGNVVSTGSYFGVDMTPLVERLLGEQLPDGGWNCEVENGATVSSFGTTINVLEGLLEYERASGGSARVGEARRRGEEYMLERRLFRRKSTGEVIDPRWLEFSFPHWYHYDVLRGLDYLRDAGHDPADRRVVEALDVVEGNRDPDGRWPLQSVHTGESHFEMEEGEGRPSRWNTLRALRALDWFADGG